MDDRATGGLVVNGHFEGDDDIAASRNGAAPLDPIVAGVIDHSRRGRRLGTGDKGCASGDRVDHGDAGGGRAADVVDHHGVFNRATRPNHSRVGLFLHAQDRLIGAANPHLGLGGGDAVAVCVKEFRHVDHRIVTAIRADLHLELDGDAAGSRNIARPLDPVVGIVIGHTAQRGRFRGRDKGRAGGNRVDHAEAIGWTVAAVGDDNRIFDLSAGQHGGDIGHLFHFQHRAGAFHRCTDRGDQGQFVVGANQAGAIVNDGATIDLLADLDLEFDRDAAANPKAARPFNAVQATVVGSGGRRGVDRAGDIGRPGRNRVDHRDAGRRAGAAIDHGDRIFDFAARDDKANVGFLLDVQDRLAGAVDLDKGHGIHKEGARCIQQFSPVADHGITRNVAGDLHLEFDGDAAAGGNSAGPFNAIQAAVIGGSG